jgi:WD40 repeat protein
VESGGVRTVVVGPRGDRVLTGGYGGVLFVIPVNGGEARRFEGFAKTDVVDGVGFSPNGRLVAAAATINEGRPQLRVWDLETDEVRVFEQPGDPEGYEGYTASSLAFVDESTFYTAGGNGLLRWDVNTGSYDRLRGPPPGGMVGMSVSADRRKMMIFDIDPSRGWCAAPGSVRYHDLVTGHDQSLEIPGDACGLFLSADGTVWTSADRDGTVWVGRIDGGAPHAFVGHVGIPQALVSPDLRWVASNGWEDKTLRLWPMPDLSKPPLHTLPHDELIAKLKSLTNLRAVRDEESSTGWKIEVGPFPGWAEVPEW